mgnify:CR=1 FL=1
MKKLILSIDQGTTSSRSILFDLKGKKIFSSQIEFEQIFPNSGWVEHNPEEIWKVTLKTIKEAIKKSKKLKSKIISIGITNQRETTILWDKDTGKPIYNAIVWQDRRTAGFNTDGTKNGSVSFIRVAVAKNENLTPEESDNMNFGAIWTPNDQTSVTLDYWTVDYKNVVTLESAQGKIDANPDSTDIIRTNGTLVGVTTSYFNAASIDASGFDLEATYSFDTPLGQASIGLNTARMLEYKIPDGAGGTKDVVGLFNHDNFARSMPETKSVITGMLSNGNHNFAAFIRNVSEYETTRAIPASAAANGYTQDIDSFTTLDLKYTFDLEWGESMITLSAGVNNATDEEAPQVYDAANFSYDAKHHDPRGVMSYLGFKITL